MTVTPAEADYSLPTNIDTSSPLVNPSHSELHNDTNRAVLDLNTRLNHVEMVMAGLTAVNGSIEQARLVANTWYVIGDLTRVVTDHTLLMPLIWNMTERVVTFKAAAATVLIPADEDIEVDLVVGAVLTGPAYDPEAQVSILKAGKIVIPAGQYTSPVLHDSDFATDHPVNTFVAAYVEQVGSTGSAGGDLTIQLNRNL